jgi:exopolysaccharide biosynthesis protein
VLVLGDGLFLNETAAVMKSLGCVDAMNLDGGGSTCMVSANKLANSPSDPEGLWRFLIYRS